VAIFADRESSWIINEAKLYYPNADFRIDRTPHGNPALYSVLLAPEDIQRLQGVTIRYWLGDSPQGEPILIRDEKSIQADWANQPPVTAPFIAQLETTLYAPQYGDYELILHTPAAASLWLDEQQLLNGEGEQRITLQLAEGDHALRIQASSGDGLFDLQWRTPNTNGANPIPAVSFYLPALVPVQGLLGNYYEGDSWLDPPALSRVDPFLDTYFHLNPLQRPYTVDWSGQIGIPVNGDWKFGLRINGQAQVFVDDQLVVNADAPSEHVEGTITLTAGRHPIHIRYLDYLGASRIHLYWTAPDGQEQVVPSEALLPYP
jgi:hypothetical protein